MNVDSVILLIAAQWERGLIVPDTEDMAPMRDLCAPAVDAGLCEPRPFQKGGPATCFALTRAGWLRYGKLTDTVMCFRD